ncbi:choice-of-anchor M domain-containing protein [Patulibacter sp. S7RM1-6]
MQYSEARRRTARSLVLALLAVLLGALATAAPASAYAPTEGRKVLGAGVHVDAVYPQIEGRRLEARTLTPDGVVDADRVALHVPETSSSHVRLPKGYEFLGPEGTEAWVTRETQDSSVVWPGWSFEGIRRGVLQGTIEIAYDGFRYAGDAKEPRFAVTQPGGLDRKKVTPLIVPGTTFTSVSGEVGAHTHATWTFTAKGTYDIDFTVKATLADGKEISDDVTVRFVVGPVQDTPTAPVRQRDPEPSDAIESLTIVPSKVDAEYFVGQTVTLTALSPDAKESDTYRWYTKPRGAKSATRDEEQTTNVFSTKPVRDLDRAIVHVERVNAAGKVVETSKPQTIRTAALPPTTTLTVKPDRSSYGVGDTARFASTQDPETKDEHYHWYLKKAGEDAYEWIPESRLADQDLKMDADLDGATITARLFNADHAVLAESEPLRLTVEGRGVDEPDATVEVTTPKTRYADGETATFTARPSASDATVEWSVRKQGENQFTVVKGDGTTLSHPVDAEWDGAEVRAVVRDAEGEAQAESSVPAIHVADGDGDAAAAVTEEASDDGGLSAAAIVIGALVLVAIVALIAVVVLRTRRGTASR